MALYDHRAYKLLVIVSILEGKTIHDKKLHAAIITVTHRSKVYAGMGEILKTILKVEEGPVSFNGLYIESSIMALCYWMREEYVK